MYVWEIKVVKKILLSYFFCLIFVASSIASPLYSVVVSVDKTSDNVTNAKQLALKEAIRNGLNDVILSISTQETVDEISKLNDKQIEHFISGLQVLMEKSSDVRYIADLKIDINENILKEFIKENNLPIIISQTENALVIPLLENQEGNLILWENENFWRDAFLTKQNLKTGFINFHNIEKNLGNITTIDANKIYDMDQAKFIEISSFNQVDSIYVLKYSLKDNKVYTKSFPDSNIFETNIETYTPTEMIDKILPLIKSNKKSTIPAVVDNQTNDFNIIYTYQTLNQWIVLKNLLENDRLVENFKIISTTNKKVHFVFTYHGDLNNLQTTLGLNGYTLNNKGEYYAIN